MLHVRFTMLLVVGNSTVYSHLHDLPGFPFPSDMGMDVAHKLIENLGLLLLGARCLNIAVTTSESARLLLLPVVGGVTG